MPIELDKMSDLIKYEQTGQDQEPVSSSASDFNGSNSIDLSEEDLIEQDSFTEKEECDPETESAYQTDFRKRRLPDRPHAQMSLLSSLLSSSNGSSSSVTINSMALQECKKTFSCAGHESSDSLPKSLKESLEWEHTHNSLGKYQNNSRQTLSNHSLTDDFSRW